MALGNAVTLVGAFDRRVNLHLGTMAAFVAVDLLLVAACLFALRANVKLRDEINIDVALLTPETGTVVPPLAGHDWTGAPQSVAYDQERRPTLVYSFSQGNCHTQQNWRAMRPLQALAPRRLRIVYVDAFGDVFTPKYLMRAA